ncbi:hypothetical protein M9H77_27265 [Catharanthus roseus]|uniref:Uncharacterized protein n=1 Tax=Catharanthus roseus TaxID=4058 RepID=A0ACC0AEQ2_CATRO|nr:hypothetical protein M9H77_27265 [Catharanthus roseus]
MEKDGNYEKIRGLSIQALQGISITSIMLVAMELRLMVGTTMEMETLLLKNIMEFVTSLFMLNLMVVLFMMIICDYERINAKYVEHSPYGCYKGSHDNYEFGDHSYGRGNFLTRNLENEGRISLERPCTWRLMLGRNHTMEFEEQ